MATISKWTPFGVALNITATAGTVTRTSATAFTVVINASWKCYWSGNKTNYGMSATSGGVTKTISSFGTSRASGSGSFTGTYSISGYGAQTKSITVTFKNFNTDNGDSATKAITLSVSVPAWPSYKVSYNANGGSGAPSAQTKYKNVALTLSSTKPTRTGYNFSKWNTASGGGGTSYNSGGSYTANAAATLYAQWTAKTYTITFNANGGSGGPGTATKTYNSALTLPTTKPTRTNYNFVGWAESSAATAAAYSAGGTYSKNITANTTLYAVWELAYYAPIVKNVVIGRYDADGNADDFGTYFKAEFSWECCQLLGSNPVASIVIGYKLKTASSYTNTTVAASGSSGVVSYFLGGSLSPDSTYDIRITVTDSSTNSPNYTNVDKSLASSAYVIDFLKGGKGVAIGKVAEAEGFDVAMASRFRGSVTADGRISSNLDDTAFVHEHPDTGVKVGFGVGSGGANHGVYSSEMGGWLLYGNGTNIFLYSPNGAYKPYFTAGDSINIGLRTAGYCTSTKTQIQFCVPLGKPIYGISSVTVTSQTSGGLKLRQGGSYTHGSSADAYAKPASYSSAYNPHGYVNVYATYGTTTNAVNNDAIGVEASITLTFNA